MAATARLEGQQHHRSATSPTISRPRLAPIAVGLGLVGGCVAMGLIDPTGGPVLCPFRAATGLYCPGCGSTRMLHHVFTGRFDLAVGDNPLSLLVLPLTLWWVFVALTAWAGGPRWTEPRFRAAHVWVLAGTVVAFWILRNIPVSPFTLLAPG